VEISGVEIRRRIWQYSPMQAPWKHFETRVLLAGGLSALLVFAAALWIARSMRREPAQPSAQEPARALRTPPLPRREKPDRFPGNTHRPAAGEGDTSGSIDLGTFSAGRDLVYVDDPRVWWESDHDTNDTECDHSMHAAVEAPLRRLIDLVDAAGGTLEVHDAYRAAGIHNPRSLHKEGRAVDLTCDALGLEELAKLCWVAGFDWVYHEAGARGGAHVHCSVRR